MVIKMLPVTGLQSGHTVVDCFLLPETDNYNIHFSMSSYAVYFS